MKICIGGAAALVLAFPFAAAQAYAPSFSELASRSDMRALAMSPDGDRVAFTLRKEITNEEGDKDVHYFLITADADTMSNVNTINLPETAVPQGLNWATNDRLLVQFQVGEANFRRLRKIKVPTSQVLAVNGDGSDAVVLMNDEKSTFEWTREGVFRPPQLVNVVSSDPKHIVMQAQKRGALDLWRVNLYSGKSEKIADGSGDTIGWDVDRQGRPALRYDSASEGRVTEIYGNADGDWRLVTRFRAEDAPEFQFEAIGDGANELVVLARANGADKRGLHIYDITTGEFERTFAVEDHVDIKDALVDPYTSELLGYRYFDGEYHAKAFDNGLNRQLQSLSQYFGPMADFDIVNISRDRETWILRVSWPNDPGGFFRFDADGPSVALIDRFAPKIDPAILGNTEVVHYETSDGAELMGFLTRPKFGAEDAPLIVMPHGGPAVVEHPSFDRRVQYLSTRGYAVFQPGFRGSDGYGEAYMKTGFGEWGRLMQQDITDGVNALIDRGDATQGRICIMGGSYGGYAALIGPVVSPELFECAVSINGVTDLIKMIEHDKAVFRDRLEAFLLDQVGDPDSDRRDMYKYSPVNNVDKYDLPVLIIAGERDQRIPVIQSRAMTNALKQAGKDVTYVEIENAGHSLEPRGGLFGGGGSSVRNWTKALGEVEKFLNEHLPVDEGGALVASSDR